MQVSNFTKQHRTVAVFDFTDADEDYVERAARLNQSLNGTNIKVDVVSLHNGTAVAGFVPEVAAAKSDDADEAINAWAKGQGYQQVLISRPGA